MNINLFSTNARERLLQGAETLTDAVKVTLGAKGRNVCIAKNNNIPLITKDGVTVAKFFNLDDPIALMGVKILRSAAEKTAEDAGDGTTTSTIIAHFLMRTGMQILQEHPNINVVQLKTAMDKASRKIIKTLEANATRIKNTEQLIKVATVSANGDTLIGTLLGEALEIAGSTGIVTLEQSMDTECSLTVQEGTKFPRGWLSPYFVTDPMKLVAEYANPQFLLLDCELNSFNGLEELLQFVGKNENPLVIIARDYSGPVLQTLSANKQQGFKVVAIQCPAYGSDRITETFKDLAALTGAKILNPAAGITFAKHAKPECLGSSMSVVVSQHQTTIIVDPKYANLRAKRIGEMQSQIQIAETDYDRERLNERLSSMAGTAVVVKVGGKSEVEMMERKARMEDALHATRASIDEGIIPGGGALLASIAKTWLYETEQPNPKNSSVKEFTEYLGQKLVYCSLLVPIVTMFKNAGMLSMDYNIWATPETFFVDLATSLNSSLSVGDLNDDGSVVGYNFSEDSFEIFSANTGVIDPVKVTRCALANAVSVSGTFLTTEAVLCEVREVE